MQVKVKICGITNLDDAMAAITAGADAIGINLYPKSKRYVDWLHAEWISILPSTIPKIAVVVNLSEAEIEAVQKSGLFNAIQFHGDETPAFCARHAGKHYIRAQQVISRERLEEALTYDTNYLLLDAPAGNDYGGTGQQFDWSLAAAFVQQHPEKRIILAGGLTPENVTEAINTVCPFAVDVASGVERAPGRKDAEKMNQFIKAVHASNPPGLKIDHEQSEKDRYFI